MSCIASSLIYLVTAGLFAGAYDPFRAATTVREFTFDKDEEVDLNNQPVNWSRRRGPLFPKYVEAFVDPKLEGRVKDYKGPLSLRFKLNGGQATYYSPLEDIDADHSYVVKALVRTSGLKHDAAMISLSFLNFKRQRLRRYLSKPVMGTHDDFVSVRIGPITPDPQVKFVVIGCHLMAGKKMDIDGDAWFDDITLGSLPRLSLSTRSGSHYFNQKDRIVIETNVLGRDQQRKHRLLLQLEAIETEGDGAVLGKTTRDFEANLEKHTDTWKLESLENGYYRIRASFERDGETIFEKKTTFAVMEPAAPGSRGRFGWSLDKGAGNMTVLGLTEVASQAGINWLKYPLWSSVAEENNGSSFDIATLLERFSRKNIEMVGLLNDPPRSLTDKFARNWTGMGVSKIFMMPTQFWHPSLEPVIARYSFRVRHWQLGGESDNSFVGMANLATTIAAVKQEFDRIGRNAQIGVHWDWKEQLPPAEGLTSSFLSLSTDPPSNDGELMQHLASTRDAGIRKWVLLKPLPVNDGLQKRTSDLVRRMVMTQLGNADAVFAFSPFDPQYGLLHPDGSPTELFLPWRTTALALQGTTYIGRFNMPHGSENVVFAGSGEALVVVWNDQPTEEEIYLGEDVYVTDLFGRSKPARKNPNNKRQILSIGQIPIILRGCSEPVARWRLAIQFERKRLPSEYGEHAEAIAGINTFPYGVSGTATLNFGSKWSVQPRTSPINKAPGEKFRLPILLEFPRDADLGMVNTSIDFELSADRRYNFTVYRPYELGLGDVMISTTERFISDGILEIEQTIQNNTDPLEILNFNCSLFIFAPGQRRQKLTVIKLGKGEDKKFYYIPNAKSLIGKKIWLRATQIDGQRVLNHHWIIRKQLPKDADDDDNSEKRKRKQ